MYEFKCFSLFSDPPEISVERPVVHSGEGYEAQLVCIVHGESQPEVGDLNFYFVCVLLLQILVKFSSMGIYPEGR